MRGDERLGAVPEVKPLGTTDPVVIGPYRLLGVLGTGGMGRVYLGTSNTGRRVAIKIIRPDLAEDPVFRARFAREVAAARRVSPLYTAAVVDADTLAAEPWLATTYIDGIGLDRQVNTHGSLSGTAVLDLGAGLGEALTSIHGVGLVHRDLKPSNILLNATGPHIIDFGLALAPEHVRMTTSLVFGTPSYMAPERLRGEEAGPPSDVFSLGATLVFASTGRDLVEDGTVYEQVLQIAQGRFDLTGVPPQVRALVVRCVSFEPTDRPTAAELTRTIVALKTVGRVDAALDDPESTLDVRAAAAPPGPRSAGPRAVIAPRGPSEAGRSPGGTETPVSPGVPQPGTSSQETSVFQRVRRLGAPVPEIPALPGPRVPMLHGREGATRPAGTPAPSPAALTGPPRARKVSRRQAIGIALGLTVAGGTAVALTALDGVGSQAQPLPGSRSSGPSRSPGPPSPTTSPPYRPSGPPVPGSIIWSARSGLSSAAGAGQTGTAGSPVVVTPDGVIVTASGGRVTAYDRNGKQLGAYTAPAGVNGLWLWGRNVLVSDGAQLILLDGTAHLLRGPVTPGTASRVTTLGFGAQLPVGDAIAISADRAYVTLGPVLACLDTKLTMQWAQPHHDPTTTSYPTAASASLLVTQALAGQTARFDVYRADRRHIGGKTYPVLPPGTGGPDAPLPGGGGPGGGPGSGPPAGPDGSDRWGITEARIGRGAIVARAGIDVRVFNPANPDDFGQMSTSHPVTAIELLGNALAIAADDLQLYDLYNVHTQTSLAGASPLRGARTTVASSMIVAIGDDDNDQNRAGWIELNRSGAALHGGVLPPGMGAPSRMFPGSHVVYLVYPPGHDSQGRPIDDVFAMAI